MLTAKKKGLEHNEQCTLALSTRGMVIIYRKHTARCIFDNLIVPQVQAPSVSGRLVGNKGEGREGGGTQSRQDNVYWGSGRAGGGCEGDWDI